MLISFLLMIIISSSLTVQGQPLPRFHVEAWLPSGTAKWTITDMLYYVMHIQEQKYMIT